MIDLHFVEAIIKLSICKLCKRAIKVSLCHSLCHPFLFNIFWIFCFTYL